MSSKSTRRLCGGLGASVARDLRALRLWQSSRQWHAVPWSCMDAAPGCRLQRRSSVNILTAWPGRVAQAPRAGRSRAPWSCSPCWRSCREPHGWGTSYSSITALTARRRSDLGNRGRLYETTSNPRTLWSLGVLRRTPRPYRVKSEVLKTTALLQTCTVLYGFKAVIYVRNPNRNAYFKVSEPPVK